MCGNQLRYRVDQNLEKKIEKTKGESTFIRAAEGCCRKRAAATKS